MLHEIVWRCSKRMAHWMCGMHVAVNATWNSKARANFQPPSSQWSGQVAATFGAMRENEQRFREAYAA
jgi:hypothetical protein